jgi:hypothetical protein
MSRSAFFAPAEFGFGGFCLCYYNTSGGALKICGTPPEQNKFCPGGFSLCYHNIPRGALRI